MKLIFDFFHTQKYPAMLFQIPQFLSDLRTHVHILCTYLCIYVSIYVLMYVLYIRIDYICNPICVDRM